MKILAFLKIWISTEQKKSFPAAALFLIKLIFVICHQYTTNHRNTSDQHISEQHRRAQSFIKDDDDDI